MEFFIEPKNIMLWNILVYFLMNGSQIFETLVFIPKWTEKPPNNFNLLLDKPGMSLKSFWTIFHSIHEIVFIVTIIICWNLPFIRLWLIILFTLHFAVRVWTIFYFAPNIIRFQKIAMESESNDNRLTEKVLRWRQLNAIRIALFMLISMALLAIYFTII